MEPKLIVYQFKIITKIKVSEKGNRWIRNEEVNNRVKGWCKSRFDAPPTLPSSEHRRDETIIIKILQNYIEFSPQDKTRQDTTRQDKTRQDKIRHDKTRQNKTRQDKTRQDKKCPGFDMPRGQGPANLCIHIYTHVYIQWITEKWMWEPKHALHSCWERCWILLFTLANS